MLGVGGVSLSLCLSPLFFPMAPPFLAYFKLHLREIGNINTSITCWATCGMEKRKVSQEAKTKV